MEHARRLKLAAGLAFVVAAVSILVAVVCFRCRKSRKRSSASWGKSGDIEFQKHSSSSNNNKDGDGGGEEAEDFGYEELITFIGGEDLTIYDILDAPGEVIGKSTYGTLYRASFERNRNSLKVLRFVRPAACGGGAAEAASVIRLLGLVRHRNLVPLQAFYAGSKGEKLLVFPFYRYGNLAQFIRDGKSGSHNWDLILEISIGVARGLNHLHTGLHKPIVHGNLKSKNILLDRHFQPLLSDFGLHLLMNPAAVQKMMESSAVEGYKAPELIKMRDMTLETDIFSLGVVLLELLTGKGPISEHPSPVPDMLLPDKMRNAVLNHKITDLLHPDMLLNSSRNPDYVTEDGILKFFRLAMACCSPSPSLRPDIKQVLKRLDEIGK